MSEIVVQQILTSMRLFWPEVTLALTFVVAMIVEFTLGRRTRAVTPSVVLLGFLVTLIQLPFYSGSAPQQLFFDMVAIDPFSVFFKVLIIATAIVIVIFSMLSGELKAESSHRGEYYCFLAAITLGLFLMSGASNLIMMYLSLELVSLTSYILAGFTKSQKRSSEAALKYVIYGGVSSGIMLYGISILYGLTGTFQLTELHQILGSGYVITSSASYLALTAAVLFILVGFGYKISAVPFHYWTPDVYEGAPITITAFLSVASKAAGFAMLLRFFFVLFMDATFWKMFEGLRWDMILAVLSVLTMTVGNVVAVWQSNMKRLLAYSSIAHAGYMLMGAVVMNQTGLTAILVYFVMYFFMNLGAFYVVMVLADRLGSEDMDDYKGLYRQAPLLATALAIFLVSLTGLPPTAGFIGKFYLFTALLQSDFIWLAVVGAINSVISLYYYARVFRNMFLRENANPQAEPLPMGPALTIITLAFVIPNIVFGLFFQPILQFAQHSSQLFLR